MYRSFIFAPANNERRIAKALSLDADGVIVDLEDACPISEKTSAREGLRLTLTDITTAKPLFVRVNALETEFCYQDILMLALPRLTGFMVPKVETASQIGTLDWVLSQIERERGIPTGCIELMPLIETVAGLANVGAVATASPRVKRIAFGAADFCLDAGLTWTEDELELLPRRAALVEASRLAEIEPPIDTPWIELANERGFSNSVKRAAQLGFQGKLCIHPNQISEVNSVFSPSDEELRRAEAIVAAFAEAEAQGLASIRVGDSFVDYAVVKRAQRILSKGSATR